VCHRDPDGPETTAAPSGAPDDVVRTPQRSWNRPPPSSSRAITFQATNAPPSALAATFGRRCSSALRDAIVDAPASEEPFASG
jgi:hypothetical protein